MIEWWGAVKTPHHRPKHLSRTIETASATRADKARLIGRQRGAFGCKAPPPPPPPQVKQWTAVGRLSRGAGHVAARRVGGGGHVTGAGGARIRCRSVP